MPPLFLTTMHEPEGRMRNPLKQASQIRPWQSCAAIVKIFKNSPSSLSDAIGSTCFLEDFLQKKYLWTAVSSSRSTASEREIAPNVAVLFGIAKRAATNLKRQRFTDGRQYFRCMHIYIIHGRTQGCTSTVHVHRTAKSACNAYYNLKLVYTYVWYVTHDSIHSIDRIIFSVDVSDSTFRPRRSTGESVHGIERCFQP